MVSVTTHHSLHKTHVYPQANLHDDTTTHRHDPRITTIPHETIPIFTKHNDHESYAYHMAHTNWQTPTYIHTPCINLHFHTHLATSKINRDYANILSYAGRTYQPSLIGSWPPSCNAFDGDILAGGVHPVYTVLMRPWRPPLRTIKGPLRYLEDPQAVLSARTRGPGKSFCNG